MASIPRMGWLDLDISVCCSWLYVPAAGPDSLLQLSRPEVLQCLLGHIAIWLLPPKCCQCWSPGASASAVTTLWCHCESLSMKGHCTGLGTSFHCLDHYIPKGDPAVLVLSVGSAGTRGFIGPGDCRLQVRQRIAGIFMTIPLYRNVEIRHCPKLSEWPCIRRSPQFAGCFTWLSHLWGTLTLGSHGSFFWIFPLRAWGRDFCSQSST